MERMTKPRRLLGLQEVVYVLGLAKATIYRLLEQRDETGEPVFPVPVRIIGTVLGWHAHEIEEWMASRSRVGASDPANPEPPPPGQSWRLLNLKEVKERTGLSRASIYRALAGQTGDGTFPLPVQVSTGRIAWYEHEVAAWIASRPRRDPPDEPDGDPGDA